MEDDELEFESVPRATQRESYERTTTAAAADDQDLQPHPDLSFHDGNVILIAEKTSFLVHRSQLERRSPVLQKKISVAAMKIYIDRAVLDKRQDRIILRLDHTAHDVAVFLDLLYNGISYRETDAQPTWDIIRPMLCLSATYQVEHLRKEAVRQLVRAFPQDIAAWEKIYAPHLPHPRPESGVMHWRCAVDCIGIANLAREFDLPQQVHFGALYFCCQLPPEKLVHGVPVAGVSAQRDGGTGGGGGGAGGSGARECLTPEDLVLCMKASRRFAEVSQTFMLNLVTEVVPSPTCAKGSGKPCKVTVDPAYDSRRATVMEVYSPLTASPLTDEQQRALCHECREQVNSLRRSMQGYMLHNLRGCFS